MEKKNAVDATDMIMENMMSRVRASNEDAAKRCPKAVTYHENRNHAPDHGGEVVFGRARHQDAVEDEISEPQLDRVVFVWLEGDPFSSVIARATPRQAITLTSLLGDVLLAQIVPQFLFTIAIPLDDLVDATDG